MCGRRPRGCYTRGMELTHGTNLALAPSLGPVIRRTGGQISDTVDRLAALGFEAIQLDATLPTIRPRELSRSGRRDLHALLRRRGAHPAGMDLFIPPWHYNSVDHGERALNATLQAIELAADLGHLPLSLALPVAELPNELRGTLVDTADRHDVPLAVHGEGQIQPLIDWIDEVDMPALGAALDPAAVLSHGADPSQTAQQLASRLTIARVSDLERGVGQASRCPVGTGQLDVATYRVSVDLAERRIGPVVLDLQGLSDPVGAAETGSDAWQNAAFEG